MKAEIGCRKKMISLYFQEINLSQFNTWIRFILFFPLWIKISVNFNLISVTIECIKVVPEIAFGQSTRVALDMIGSGFANFGAYLMEQNVTTLTVAPKDHGTKVQLALERGIPAMVAAFGTRHWPFPSQAFDLIQCSRCGMNWTLDGIYMPLSFATTP